MPRRGGLEGEGLQEAPREGGLSASAGSVRPALRLLRPRQWSKNLLVFAALVFAEELFVPRSFGLACLAFACFCLASSSAYVVNDLLDVERDRLHPEKRRRPIAAGEVTGATAWALEVALAAGTLLLAFWINGSFGVVVVTYLGLSHFYSLRGKNIAILDVLLIASGFVLRAIGGAVAISVPISSWFILFTVFGALFLALSKRRAEMLALSGGAADQRPVLERYTPATLSAFAATSMASVLMSYALYLLDIREQSGGQFQLLDLTLPFVLFGVFRYHLLVETQELGERPEEVFLSDRPLQACVAGFVLVAVAALYL